MTSTPWLNSSAPLLERFRAALEDAVRFDVAVAYAKSSGVDLLLESDVPPRGRVLVGIGFGLTDPEAVERLAGTVGLQVRVFVGTDDVDATQFHPKIYIVGKPREIVVFSGSGNLTRGGLTSNIEQYEEARLPLSEADVHLRRFDELWSQGIDFDELRASGAWDRYIAIAKARRDQEQTTRRAEAETTAHLRERIRRHRAAGRRSVNANGSSQRDGASGYLAPTSWGWWDQQVAQRSASLGGPIFWRRNSRAFRALAEGGWFFHLLNRGVPDGDRTLEGLSVFTGDYEVMRADDAWDRYGPRLGVTQVDDLASRLDVDLHDDIGLIHLSRPLRFIRPPALDGLRDAGVRFARETVSGRRLSPDEVEILLRLGGATD